MSIVTGINYNKRMSVKHFSFYWFPVLLWASFIYYLSDQPDLTIVPDNLWDLILRKVAHLFVFAVLYLLLVRALGKRHLIFAFLLALLYAISDEIHQRYVPTRHASVTDILFDTMGVLVAHIIWSYERTRHSKQKTLV